MDPLSLAFGIGGLVPVVAKIITASNALCQKYTTASEVVPALVAECQLIKHILEQVQKQVELQATSINRDNEILDTIQNSTAACSVLLHVLLSDLKQMEVPGAQKQMLGKRTKFQLIWNEERRSQLLTQLRAQCSMLDVLLRSLQSNTLDEILRTLRANAEPMQQTVASSQRLISTRPIHDPASIDTGSVLRFTNRPVQHRPLNTAGQALQLPSVTVSAASSRPIGPHDDQELFEAVRTRNYGLLTILLESGADTSLRNADGHSALSQAIHLEDLEACKVLLRRGQGTEATCYNAECLNARPIHIASQANTVEIIELLIEKGADISATSAYRRSALHWAVLHDSPEATAFLLNHGLSLELEDADGNTSLHMAISARVSASLMTVLANSVTANRSVLEVVNRKGQTPIQLSVETGWLEGYRWLRGIGANETVIDKDGATLLHKAAHLSINDMVLDLVTAGASVHTLDGRGRTVLHYCVLSKFDCRRTLRLLHDYGANLDAQSDLESTSAFLVRKKGGPTPLIMAVQEKKLAVVDCLLGANAAVDVTMACGCDVLQVAKDAGDLAFFKAILTHELRRTVNSSPLNFAHAVLALAIASRNDFPKIHARVLGNAISDTKPSSMTQQPLSACSYHVQDHSTRLIGAAITYCKGQQGFSLTSPNVFLSELAPFAYAQQINNSTIVSLLLAEIGDTIRPPPEAAIPKPEEKERPSQVYQRKQERVAGSLRLLGYLIYSICYLAIIIPLWVGWHRHRGNPSPNPDCKGIRYLISASVITGVGLVGYLGIFIPASKVSRTNVEAWNGLLAVSYILAPLIVLWTLWDLHHKMNQGYEHAYAHCREMQLNFHVILGFAIFLTIWMFFLLIGVCVGDEKSTEAKKASAGGTAYTSSA